jgi:hypothetical protein
MPKFDIESLEKSLHLIGKPLPKVISPTVHAIADYVTAASFVVAGVFFWKKNKRAALASLLCGAAETAVATLTDYPGGVKDLISFPLHGKIDYGMAGMVAAMPQFLAFEDEGERGFFRMQSVMIGGLAAATRFEPQQIAGEQERQAA